MRESGPGSPRRYRARMQDQPSAPRVSTLEDVALVAGVSRASVSRVVNGNPGVAAHIVDAVNVAIAHTGYVPNRAARALVTRRS